MSERGPAYTTGADEARRQLSILLARGYLRVLTANRQDSVIARDSAPQESPTGPRIGVDVAGEKMAQLPRGQAR